MEKKKVELTLEDWKKLEEETKTIIENQKKGLALNLEILELCQTRITSKA